MPRRLWCTLGAAALLLSPPASVSAAESPGREIVAAAEEGLPQFVRGIPDAGLARFGLRSRGEAAALQVAQGFRIHTVLPADVIETAAGAGLDALAVPTELWQFLVAAGERPAALLTVDRVDGRWRAVSIGAAGLAEQLDAVLAAWPAAAGYDWRVIRVYQAASDFVEIARDGRTLGLLPLTSARVALGLTPPFDPTDLRDARALLDAVRPAVRANLEGAEP